MSERAEAISDPVIVTPDSAEELPEVIRAHPRLLAVGNRTKQPLSLVDATLVSLQRVSGILEYEPSEFTFTALAGTPLSDIAGVLREKNQCMPFDPMLVLAGATLGGAVASGLSGPGRYRYGGLRDFLLGMRLLTGEGEFVRVGGKVVKNAAGFDIPKFLVGSCGRMGVMTELTFKVFPLPTTTRTLRVQCESHQQAIERMSFAASSRWELDAIDYRPGELAMYLRVGGPAESCHAVAADIANQWGSDATSLDSADAWWRDVVELCFQSTSDSTDWCMVKVPTTPKQFVQLQAAADSVPFVSHWSVAGAVLWIAVAKQHLGDVDRMLASAGGCGLVVRGPATQAWLGTRVPTEIADKLASVMDPEFRFPAIA